MDVEQEMDNTYYNGVKMTDAQNQEWLDQAIKEFLTEKLPIGLMIGVNGCRGKCRRKFPNGKRDKPPRNGCEIYCFINIADYNMDKFPIT